MKLRAPKPSSIAMKMKTQLMTAIMLVKQLTGYSTENSFPAMANPNLQIGKFNTELKEYLDNKQASSKNQKREQRSRILSNKRMAPHLGKIA